MAVGKSSKRLTKSGKKGGKKKVYVIIANSRNLHNLF